MERILLSFPGFLLPPSLGISFKELKRPSATLALVHNYIRFYLGLLLVTKGSEIVEMCR